MNLRKLANHLKEHEPLKRISVRFIPGDKMPRCENNHPYEGECIHKNGEWVIKLNRDRPTDLIAESMVHEFAHVRAGIKGDFEKDHNERWAMAFADFYKIMRRWVESE